MKSCKRALVKSAVKFVRPEKTAANFAISYAGRFEVGERKKTPTTTRPTVSSSVVSTDRPSRAALEPRLRSYLARKQDQVSFRGM